MILRATISDSVNLFTVESRSDWVWWIGRSFWLMVETQHLRYQFGGKADEKAADRNEVWWIGFEKSDGTDEGLMVDINPNWFYQYFLAVLSSFVIIITITI